MKKVVRFIIRIILTVLYRVEFIGRENVPLKGAALLCANHPGELDMFFIGCKIKRIVHYMAKEELFKNPLVSAFITWVGAFPVKRGKVDIGAVKKAYTLLSKGHIVGILPEGTRVGKKDRKNVKVWPGAAMIAVNANVPVIPVGVNGDYKLFSKVRVVFGKPYYLEVDRNKKYTKEEFSQMSRDIMDKIYSLVEEI